MSLLLCLHNEYAFLWPNNYKFKETAMETNTILSLTAFYSPNSWMAYSYLSLNYPWNISVNARTLFDKTYQSNERIKHYGHFINLT